MAERKSVNEKLANLRARVRELEALLVCVECGHLRNDHDENKSPCFGGRTPGMKAGEGEYCDCAGFTSEAMRVEPARTREETPVAWAILDARGETWRLGDGVDAEEGYAATVQRLNGNALVGYAAPFRLVALVPRRRAHDTTREG